jgi:H+/Cl- antiporter ClcA
MKMAKKVAPLAGAAGVVSDIASPVVEFSNKLPFKGLVDVITALLAVASVSLAFYWFMFVKKKLKENEDSIIPEILTTCLIATLVFSFFSFGQLLTGSKDKGLVAAVVPGVEGLQKSLFRLEENQKEMKN